MFCWSVHHSVKGRPELHYDATAVAVGNKVYTFLSGRCNNMDQICVHVFNTVSLRWMQLPPVTTGRSERNEYEYAFIMIMDHTAVLVEDIIYVWGGFTYRMGLYVFNVDTHRWFKPKTSGMSVQEAWGTNSACVLGKVMYVYGGLLKRLYDIYKLDTTTMVWSLINTRGTPPPVSQYDSATIIGTKMFVFGGRTNGSGPRGSYNTSHYNTIRVFDTETDCWLSTPSAQLLPEARCGHSAFAYNGELYISGGEGPRLNDLWRFNPDTFSWKKVELKWEGPRTFFKMCCCMVGDCIVFFGFVSRDDLYILDLSPSLKTLCKRAVVQYGLEPSELPHDIRWELAVMTTNSNKKEDHYVDQLM